MTKFVQFFRNVFGINDQKENEIVSYLERIAKQNDLLLVERKEDFVTELQNQNSNTIIEVLKEFKFSGTVAGSDICFKLVNEDLLDNKYKPIPMNRNDRMELKGTLSNIGGSIANLGISSLATKGLFMATAPIETLMKYAGGEVSSIVTNGGQIGSHAGFIQAGTTIFTPLLVFQLASMVTGQYYMNGITKQLNAIQSKLDQLLMFFHIERQARLKESFQMLADFSKRKVFEIEDFVIIKHILLDLTIIREEYFLMLEEIQESFLENVNYSLSSSKWANNICDHFEESGFFYKLNSSLKADEIYHLGKLVEFHMNLCVKAPSIDRINLIAELYNQMTGKKEYMLDKTKQITSKIKTQLIEGLLNAQKDALFGNKKIDPIISTYRNQFIVFENEKKKTFDLIGNMYSSLTLPLQSKNEIIIDNRFEEPILYLK